MSQTQIEEIELSIEAAKEMVERGRMADKLATYPEFRKLVLDGYFRDEAARLAHLSSDPNLPEDIRNHVLRDMQGVGAFKRFLMTIRQLGEMAAREIDEAGQALEELRAEEPEGFEA